MANFDFNNAPIRTLRHSNLLGQFDLFKPFTFKQNGGFLQETKTDEWGFKEPDWQTRDIEEQYLPEEKVLVKDPYRDVSNILSVDPGRITPLDVYQDPLQQELAQRLDPEIAELTRQTKLPTIFFPTANGAVSTKPAAGGMNLILPALAIAAGAFLIFKG